MEKIVVIAGPTAVGKSALSVELASRFNGEVVSADSNQIYRGMDIGTAKPSRELRSLIPHHLIDIIEPDGDYSAARFMRDADRAIKEIIERRKRVFIVGGAGLYIKALLYGVFEGPCGVAALRERFSEEASVYGKDRLHRMLLTVDPLAAGLIHPNDTRRLVRALEVYHSTGRPISEFHKGHGFSVPRYRALKIGLEKDRRALYGDIGKRVEKMMEDGFVEEARGLYARGFKNIKAIGYGEILAYMEGKATLEDAVSEIKKKTRNYAKRQLTWFKKDGEVRWFPAENTAAITSAVREFFRE